ncbi:hypothetical protein [Micromonospora sp. ATCC 39149]|uniref:hypothetical protein n=1 Tax=Micromonospora sp. (strain ATCC 39149 / NRRL 15099 / SCC 1413) TaxID=219305 RepID=UPI00350FC759
MFSTRKSKPSLSISTTWGSASARRRTSSASAIRRGYNSARPSCPRLGQRSSPVDPLAHLIMGALDESTRYIATAADPATARHECLWALRRMFEGLKRPTSAP